MCEECGERPATVYVAKSVNGERSEMHLCTRCALEKGEIGPLMQSPGWLLDQFLSFLTGITAPALGEPASARRRPQAGIAPAPARCPHCGREYAEFARTGLLGCARCYDAFRAPLAPAIRQMHGAAAHLGARPGRAPARPGAEGAPSSRAAGRGPAPGEGGGGGPGRAAPEAEASRPAETREARLLRLREALKEAVSAERFEEAARLRDEIRALEAGGPSSGSGGAGREAKG